ncbi:MAG: glycosyltransferase family 2 protein [Anaerolineae bacterium]|nr:glycosyltransferase family 2 protein [Anaerolineae bacterium]
MSKESRTIIVMPAHNEAGNIERVITELRQAVQGLDFVVIDDYSSDDTAAVAERMGAEVVRLPCNLGYGGAVQTGFRYAIQRGYDYAVMMDSDGQHDPRSVPALLEVVESREADVALGSRFLGRMEYQSSWVRRVGMSIFSHLVSVATGRHFTDATSGLQALNREVLEFFSRDNYPVDFPDADTIILLHYAGFRVKEVPVTMRERISGESMHASLKPIYYVFKMALAIFIVMLRQRTHVNAVRPDTARHERG